MLPVLVSGKNVMLRQILRGNVKRERQQAHPITPDCPDAWDGSFPRVAPETRTRHRIALSEIRRFSGSDPVLLCHSVCAFDTYAHGITRTVLLHAILRLRLANHW